jgi:hypothetical protein
MRSLSRFALSTSGLAFTGRPNEDFAKGPLINQLAIEHCKTLGLCRL